MNMKRLISKSAFQMAGRPIFRANETDNCSKNIFKRRKKGLPGIQEADYPFQLLPYFSGMFCRNGYGEARGGV